ncbi:hypothetical protein AOQ84DRAFT_407568 [Glonium stellatum]|uniref:Uncharacterized protein n=1 Tax=Glonium stellatum TaxID=574774 RepID=A0A8E2JT16_9PEZI|nr:hypothetical protein AOQ84DRAFT_407568 [Glonium stellatum]
MIHVFEPKSSIAHTSYVLLFILIDGSSASSTFRPNCTRPPDGVNFVYKADIRATFDILWSCLFTLLICTWTVQHLNIPDQSIIEDEAPPKWSLSQKFHALAQKKWSHFFPKLKWMLLTLLLPEFLLGKAFQDRVLAGRSWREMQPLAKADKVEWTLTHSFYANMGGFVLKAKKRHIKSGSEDVSFQKAYIFLDSERLYLARSGGESDLHKPILEHLPSITQDEIDDKSKGDFFVKATALIQVLWLLIQVVIRAARGLVVSQLEIVVLAYSVCTIITYVLCWSKPQGTQIPTAIKLPKPVNVDLLELVSTVSRIDCLHSLPNDGRYDKASSLFLPKEALQTLLDDGFVIGAVVFGAVHCSAWNFHFPTSAEKLLWRIASTLSTGVVPLYYVVLLYDFHVKKFRFLSSYLWFFENVVVLSYMFARLYLLFEVFRSLCFLPPEAFLTTWVQQIPHVS